MNSKIFSSLEAGEINHDHFKILKEADLEEPGFLQEMILGFENNGKKILESLENCFVKLDFEEFKIKAHKLRGLAGILGAHKLGDIAKKLEEESSRKSDPLILKDLLEQAIFSHKKSLLFFKRSLQKGVKTYE